MTFGPLYPGLSLISDGLIPGGGGGAPKAHYKFKNDNSVVFAGGSGPAIVLSKTLTPTLDGLKIWGSFYYQAVLATGVPLNFNTYLKAGGQRIHVTAGGNGQALIGTSYQGVGAGVNGLSPSAGVHIMADLQVTPSTPITIDLEVDDIGAENFTVFGRTIQILEVEFEQFDLEVPPPE